VQWWPKREENEHAWKAKAVDVLKYGGDGQLLSANLDVKNPRTATSSEQRRPQDLIGAVLKRYERVVEIVREINASLPAEGVGTSSWPRVSLSEVLTQSVEPVAVDPSLTYPNLGIYSFGRGLFRKHPIDGQRSSARVLFRVRAGQFIYSRLFAFEGAYGVVPKDFDGWFVSNEYPVFNCDGQRLDVEFLRLFLSQARVWEQVATGSQGLGHRRQRVQPPLLLRFRVPLPTLEEQRRLVTLQTRVDAAKTLQAQTAAELDALLPSILDKAFRGET